MPRRKSRSKAAPAEEPIEAESTPLVEQTSDFSDQSCTKRSSRQNVETSSSGSGSSAPSERSRRSTTVAQTAASQAGARVTRSLTRGPTSASPPPPRRSRGSGSSESPALRVKSSPRIGSKISYQEDSEGEEDSGSRDVKQEEEEFQVEDEMESDSEESRDAGKRKGMRSRQVAVPRNRRRSSSGKKGGRGKAIGARAKKPSKAQKEEEEESTIVDVSETKEENKEKDEKPKAKKEIDVVEESTPRGGRRRSGRQTVAVESPAPVTTSGRAKRSRAKVSQAPVETPSPTRRSGRARKTLMEDVKETELDDEEVEVEEDEDYVDEEGKMEIKPRVGRKRKVVDELVTKNKKSKPAAETPEDSESKMEVDENPSDVSEEKPALSDVSGKDEQVERKGEEDTADGKIKEESKEQPMDVEEVIPKSVLDSVKVEDKKKDESPQIIHEKQSTPEKEQKKSVALDEMDTPPVPAKVEPQAQAVAKSETPKQTSPVNKSPIPIKPVINTPSTKLPSASPVKLVQSVVPSPTKIVQPLASSTKPVQPQLSPMQISESPKGGQPIVSPAKIVPPLSPVKNVQLQSSLVKSVQPLVSQAKTMQPLPPSPAKVVQAPLISPKIGQPMPSAPKVVRPSVFPVKACQQVASPTKNLSSAIPPIKVNQPIVSPPKNVHNIISPAKSVLTGPTDKVMPSVSSPSKNLQPVSLPKTVLNPEKTVKSPEKQLPPVESDQKKTQHNIGSECSQPVQTITPSHTNVLSSAPVDSKSPSESQNSSSATQFTGSPPKAPVTQHQQPTSSNLSQRSPAMHSTPPAIQPLSATPGAINTMRSHPPVPPNTVNPPVVQDVIQSTPLCKGGQVSSASGNQLKLSDQAVNGNKDKSSQNIADVPLTHNGPPSSNRPVVPGICLPGRKNINNLTCPATGLKFVAVSFNLCGISATNRHEKILMEIKILNADILCLQEVDSEYFRDKLENGLDVLGYKGQRSTNGLATFFRVSVLSSVLQKTLPILEIVNKDLQICGLDAEAENAVKTYLQKEVNGEVMYTQVKIGSKTLNVANIYIKKCDISTHALQVSCIVRELLKQSDTDSNHSQLLCGTFSMDESFPGYQLIRDGYLNNDMIDTLQKQTHIQIPNKENSALVNLLWESFQHSSSQLKSSYATVIGHELKKQSSENVKLPLDSMWFSSDSLGTRSVLDVEPSFESIDKLSLRAELCFIN